MVVIYSFSKEEVNGTTKFNYAKNTLDKDNTTVWAADDGAIVTGDYKGDGEYIIYDLDTLHNLNLIQFSTTNKSDPFGFQIWVSTSGTATSDFSIVLPTSGDLLLTATNTAEFNQYEINETEARYVKLIGFGRYNSVGNLRKSVWSAVGEIEFYGNETVSLIENKLVNNLILYPVPSKDTLYFKNLNRVKSIIVYDIEGKKIIEESIKNYGQEVSLNVSTLPNGTYIIILKGERLYQSKKIIVSR